MANRRNEEGMPAEQGNNPRGMPDDRSRDYEAGEDVRGIGESDASDEEFEDTEDLDESKEDEDEEGSF